MRREQIERARAFERTGERSCVWCHNELRGDHAELYHSVCGPDVAQIDLFRQDMRRLDELALGYRCALGLLGAVSFVVLSDEGWKLLDGLFALELGAALWILHWVMEERLRVTRGMWRKVRAQSS